MARFISDENFAPFRKPKKNVSFFFASTEKPFAEEISAHKQQNEDDGVNYVYDFLITQN